MRGQVDPSDLRSTRDCRSDAPAKSPIVVGCETVVYRDDYVASSALQLNEEIIDFDLDRDVSLLKQPRMSATRKCSPKTNDYRQQRRPQNDLRTPRFHVGAKEVHGWLHEQPHRTKGFEHAAEQQLQRRTRPEILQLLRDYIHPDERST
jgi:hypothetical protein